MSFQTVTILNNDEVIKSKLEELNSDGFEVVDIEFITKLDCKISYKLVENICPTITLGALNQDVFFDGTSGTAAQFTISPAAANSYIITVVSGSLPTNTSVGGQVATGSVNLNGHSNWVYGKYTFTLRATDPDTGCFGEQTYTITVQKKYSVAGTPTIPTSNDIISNITVSGIPGTIGTNARVYLTSVTAAIDDLSTCMLRLFAPSGDSVTFFNPGDLTGANLSSTSFTSNSVDPITDGSAPYTGEWMAEYGNMDGSDINGTWSFGGFCTPSGVLTQAYFIISPI